MTSLLALLVLLAADGGSPDAGLSCGGAPCAVYPSAKQAFARVVEATPEVLGIGEYHEVGQQKVSSALKRFTLELLPLLKGRAGAMVAETWITNGRCGEVEKEATKEVAKVTRRPKTTEDELTHMLDRSYQLGFKNHVLKLSCDEYRSMLDPHGELDAEKSLLLVRQKVAEKVLEALEKGEAPQGRLVVLYGGAIHNDLFPVAEYAPYAFGRQLQEATDGGYAELDLLVPQFVEQDEDLAREPWFAPALKLAQKGRVVLVEPHPRSFMLLFSAK